MDSIIEAQSDNGQPTAEEAREVLAQERKEREAVALTEFEQFINYWGKKHNCRLDVSMIVTIQGNIPKLQILAND